MKGRSIVLTGLLVALVSPCAWSQCDCPGQFDPNRNGIPCEIGDLVLTWNRAFYGLVDTVTTPTCICQDGDLDCSGLLDVLDVVGLLGVICGDFDPAQLCGPDFSCSLAHCPAGARRVTGGDVFVESKAVPAGATGVHVGVYFFNSVNLSAIILPLEFRSITTGSFIADSLSVTVHGRLASSGFVTSGLPPLGAYYAAPATVNSCSGPVANSYDTAVWALPLPLTGPLGVLWGGMNTGPCLPPGFDGFPGNGTPSLVLTFSVTQTAGSFEIDTCCIAPGSHLAFVDCNADTVLIPQFTKGVITIGGEPGPCACACVADPRCDGTADIVDVVAVINAAFRGGHATQDLNCSSSREDVDCNGHADIIDVTRMISVALRGVDPSVLLCDPCGP